MPERIQLSRKRGWRMPENTRKVDRSSRWGNPFEVRYYGLQRSIQLFENVMCGYWNPALFNGEPDWLLTQAYQDHQAFWEGHHCCPAYWAENELRGKNLACWCAIGSACHADVLLRLANPTAEPGDGAA